MAVFSIIGTILLVILFIILGLLALVLLLVLLLLFAPLKYKAHVTAKGEGGFGSVKPDIHVKGHWLFRIVRFSYSEDKAIVKVLWIKLNAEKAVEETVKALPTVAADTILEPDLNLAHTIAEDIEAEKVGDAAHSIPPTGDELPKSKFQTIKERILNAKEKYTAIMNHPDRREIQTLTITLLKKLLKVLKPHTFQIFGKFGLNSPDKTGMVLGGLYALHGITHFNINVNGDFDNEMIDITAYIADKLNLFQIGYPLVRFALRKKVRPIVFGLIKNK